MVAKFLFIKKSLKIVARIELVFSKTFFLIKRRSTLIIASILIVGIPKYNDL